MRIMILWLGAAWILGAGLGCGSPEMTAPEELTVVYMPLDGAIGVDPSVEPEVFFSAALNEATITDSSVKLEQSAGATEANNTVECTGEWTAVDGDPVRGSTDRSVQFSPQASLPAGRCFRLLVTTALRGSNQETLRALDLQDTSLADVGAISTFATEF